MEGKLEDFMTDLREHITTLINTVCKLELVRVAVLKLHNPSVGSFVKTKISFSTCVLYTK